MYIYIFKVYIQDMYIHTQTFTYAFRHLEFSGISIVFSNTSITESIELDIYRYLLRIQILYYIKNEHM